MQTQAQIDFIQSLLPHLPGWADTGSNYSYCRILSHPAHLFEIRAEPITGNRWSFRVHFPQSANNRDYFYANNSEHLRPSRSCSATRSRAAIAKDVQRYIINPAIELTPAVTTYNRTVQNRQDAKRMTADLLAQAGQGRTPEHRSVDSGSTVVRGWWQRQSNRQTVHQWEAEVYDSQSSPTGVAIKIKADTASIDAAIAFLQELRGTDFSGVCNRIEIKTGTITDPETAATALDALMTTGLPKEARLEYGY